MMAYILVIYTGGSRFSHMLYLGCQEILATLLAVVKLPMASTTLTRVFKKINKMKEVEAMSEGFWGILIKDYPMGRDKGRLAYL